MRMITLTSRFIIIMGVCAAVAVSASLQAIAANDVGTVKCHLNFDLDSWSVFYKSGKGDGRIHCNNGQSVAVKIRAHGGGVTFGKTKILDGKGSFSKVKDIGELYGSYAVSEAHAGAKGSAGAQAMTNGDVSLAISGTGEGYNLGFAFGSFKITPR